MATQTNPNQVSARRTIGRLLIAALSFLYIATGLFVGYGEWLEKHPTSQNLELGRQWVSADPVLWRLSGRSQILSFQPEELRSSARALQESLARDPFEAVGWDDLATVESRLGDPVKQEHSLQAAVRAFPHSPGASWAWGNFLLQHDRQREAFPFFRTAAGDDPALRTPEFELGWKLLADPQQILNDMVPEDPESRMQYLAFLVWTKGVVWGAYPVWREISSSRGDEVIQLGESYTEALASRGFGEEASRVWNETWPGDAGASGTDERVVNGSFEKPLRNGGLDWRIVKDPGYQVALDDFVAREGGRSLRVQFDGTTNPEFGGVREWIPVGPGRDYHLRGFIKTENLSTSSGMCLAVATVSAPTSEAWEKTTEASVGTTPWTEVQLDFRTGPNTRVVLLALRRRQSDKLDNLLRGTVWLDEVSLKQRS